MKYGGWLLSGAILVAVALSYTSVNGQPTGTGGKSSASDHTMVERLINARKEYQETLEALRAYYIAVGDLERARWAEDELLQFHRIAKQPFRLDQIVPPANLSGSNNIPEANNLLRQAQLFKDKGWGQEYTDNQRRAELLLQQLLTKYPQSDKISEVAYLLGDLYEGKAYRQYAHAALYFERCFQWNPKTQSDARLRAARIYEKLNERAHAIDIYKQITSHEADPKRIEEAQKKLTELSGGR
jgi:tetratricopeptide (TPR) repeat protein